MSTIDSSFSVNLNSRILEDNEKLIANVKIQNSTNNNINVTLYGKNQSGTYTTGYVLPSIKGSLEGMNNEIDLSVWDLPKGTYKLVFSFNNHEEVFYIIIK